MRNISSILLHSDMENGEPHKAHLNPIYASSTYYFNTAEEAHAAFQNQSSQQQYIYGRFGSPTHTGVERTIEKIEAFNLKDESGKPLEVKAIIHGSGMGAISNLFLSCLQHGDEALTHFSLYGGTQEYMDKILTPLNIKIHIIPFSYLDEVEDILKKNPKIKLLYIESPSNPRMQCCDIATLSAVAKKYGVKVACDNSFSTAYLQQPFALGADFVIYSATKFLNGHGNLIGGVLVGKDLELMNGKVLKNFKLLGACLSPFDTYMLGCGIKTLPLRMDRHCSNALQLATFLESHPKVKVVNYGGLKNHPQHALIQKQMKHAGAMLSFEIKGNQQSAFTFLNSLKMCKHAVSLGTLDTILCHPATSTHIGLKPEDKVKFGISETLIRVSTGLEGIEDILEDFTNTLQKF